LLVALAQTDFPLRPKDAAACVFAVAGPVRGGRYCSPPNISWDVDLDRDAPDLAVATVINDFVAQAFACQSVIGEEALNVLDGEADPQGTIAAVGAGTGLGEAALLRIAGDKFVAGSSEGGHASFCAQNLREQDFAQFLISQSEHPYAIWDEVVSGSGIAAVHHFLTGERRKPEELTSEALRDSETLEWSARFYARVCRNYALDVLATGGLFIAGGVAAKVPELVQHRAFAQEFRLSGTHTNLLKRIPVKLITSEESGLWGAARYAQQWSVRAGS